jgi:hypothetical protein
MQLVDEKRSIAWLALKAQHLHSKMAHYVWWCSKWSYRIVKSIKKFECKMCFALSYCMGASKFVRKLCYILWIFKNIILFQSYNIYMILYFLFIFQIVDSFSFYMYILLNLVYVNVSIVFLISRFAQRLHFLHILWNLCVHMFNYVLLIL